MTYHAKNPVDSGLVSYSLSDTDNDLVSDFNGLGGDVDDSLFNLKQLLIHHMTLTKTFDHLLDDGSDGNGISDAYDRDVDVKNKWCGLYL